jgi:hypothetical protein
VASFSGPDIKKINEEQENIIKAEDDSKVPYAGK